MTAILSTIGAVAWAQNLEVKGSAWFATGGSGNAGIGTGTPLAKLHVFAPGGFSTVDDATGHATLSNVPILGQSSTAAAAGSSSAVYGILNSKGRQLGAISVGGDSVDSATARGFVAFQDRSDGLKDTNGNNIWHTDLVLNAGRVGVGGQTAPAYALDVNGDVHATGDLYAGGKVHVAASGWDYGDGFWMKTIGGRPIWTDGIVAAQTGLNVGYQSLNPPGGGAVISGNLGVGTSSPSHKLDVRGDIAAGNSDLYFTKTDHLHTGAGNATGNAAIENSSDYNTLMLLGRSGAAPGQGVVGRKVSVWDYLEVNGNTNVLGNVTITGRIHAAGGTSVYLNECDGNSLSANPTCQACGPSCQSGDQSFSCCTMVTVSNTLIGRLVDP